MNQDFSELIDYLDKKFAGVLALLFEKASDHRELGSTLWFSHKGSNVVEKGPLSRR
jgi:hypothetical protein